MEKFKLEVAEAIAKALEKDRNEIIDEIEKPKDKKMGDFAYPCFKLSKEFKKSPALIAEEIKEKIVASENIEKVEVVSGYLNFFIKNQNIVESIMCEIIEKKENYLESVEGAGKNVCIDYSAPNIAKPFHIGHLRSTVIGKAIYNIYKKLGYNVIGINYLGDFGTQFGLVIEGYKRWGTEYNLEKDPIKSLVDIYVRTNEAAKEDETIKENARANFKALENGEAEVTEMWKKFRALSLKEYERIYKILGVTFDSYNGEAYYNDKMEEIVNILREKNVMVKSEGAMVVELKGHELPCMILKSNGSTTYTTRDLAAALDRKRVYDFDKSIYVTSYEQILHFTQMFKVAKHIVGEEYAKRMVHVPFGMVLGKGGKKISTRGGINVTLEDILNEAITKSKEILEEKGKTFENIDEISRMIGVGAIIFNDLKNNRIKDEIFNLEDMLKFEGETGPYVQYMYVRTKSILEKSKVNEEEYKSNNLIFKLLKEKEEVNLIKELSRVKEIIKQAANEYEPSLITRYVIDIASLFSKYYNEHQIIIEDRELMKVRLALVYATNMIIKECLEILGIKCPDKM
ncbi:MAG: arginine--tRNA ligase [Clostridia bacterium]|nr:arginine--tRNA ligase [Clostridia bacterium]